MDRPEIGKLIVSAAKSLKGYQIADPSIANFLYGTKEAGRLGLFVSAVKSENNTAIDRIQTLAAQEGIAPPLLTGELLPWLEGAGLCELQRDIHNNITQFTSLVLAYIDLLGAVADFYETKNPTHEDRACLRALELASELPRPQSTIRQVLANQFGNETAHKALQLAKAYKIVAFSGPTTDPLLYAPRVWAGLGERAPQVLAPLDLTAREILIDLINRVRENQGFPESLLRTEARKHGCEYLVDLSIGIALMNRTELQMGDGTKRLFLTTPHFYDDLRSEYGEDMCDRVKIFLDSIRNGQYFGSLGTGKIFNPELLLRALINRGRVGPATAIQSDYIVAEKAGIIRVTSGPYNDRAYMDLNQEDTARKVLEIVSSGTVESARPGLDLRHLADGHLFQSIEQGRAHLGTPSGKLLELEHDVIKRLREA